MNTIYMYSKREQSFSFNSLEFELKINHSEKDKHNLLQHLLNARKIFYLLHSFTHCDRPFHLAKKVAESISAGSENLLNMTGSFRFNLWELPLHLQITKKTHRTFTFTHLFKLPKFSFSSSIRKKSGFVRAGLLNHRTHS